jgi:hypothetical protein
MLLKDFKKYMKKVKKSFYNDNSFINEYCCNLLFISHKPDDNFDPLSRDKNIIVKDFTKYFKPENTKNSAWLTQYNGECNTPNFKENKSKSKNIRAYSLLFFEQIVIEEKLYLKY